MIRLKAFESEDLHEFVVDKAVASQSQTIQAMLDELSSTDDVIIPLPNLSGRVLGQVIKYCSKHVSPLTPDTEDDIQAWDAYYIKGFTQEELYNLILAANYLNIAPLLGLACRCVADMLKDKTVEDLRKEFGIVNDFTPEEEMEIGVAGRWFFKLHHMTDEGVCFPNQ